MLSLCMGLALAAGTTMGADSQPPQPRDCSPATDEPLHGGLPFFDARQDAAEMPVAAVTAAIRKSQAARAAIRAGDEAKLRAVVPTVQISDSPQQGTPQTIQSLDQQLTGASPAAPIDVVKGFVGAYTGLLEIDAREIDQARRTRDYADHFGMHHFILQQQIRGVDLFDAEVRAHIAPDGSLINFGTRMLPRPEGDFVVQAPRLSDLDAIRFAANSAGVAYTQVITPATDQQGPSLKRTWNNTGDFRADEPITTELVYFPMTRDDIRTAWSVVIPVKGVGHTYDIIIDASTGELLRRQDRLVWDLSPMTFRVFNSDGVAPGSPGTSTPNGFQYPEVARTLLTVNTADISAIDPNGWITTGVNDTQGNNVDAHLDLNADNAPDLPRPNGGASRVFDFTFDSTLAPTSWRDFAVTELFWRGNWYHDRLWELGFTEGAGNFQIDNFGRGGIANDAVQADAQDGSGTNNANFSTSGSDGSSARCQMYIFTGPTPDRDGDLDGDIVYHEFTHGTSIRLHVGISGTQGGGMGEGWSDYYGISLLAQSGDDPDAVYSTGAYTTYLLSAGFTNNYYFGIRRYPYSTDMTKSPLTLADMDASTASAHAGVPRSPVIGNTPNEVHNIGEIWCATLLHARANLMHTYGFAGNQRMLQLVTTGMTLATHGSPQNFLEERDAIILADRNVYGGGTATPDFCDLWRAFAQRGMGQGAAVSTSGGTTGVVESYTIGGNATFSFPDGLPTQLQPGVGNTFRVNISASGATITPGTEVIFVSRNGGAFTSQPLTPVTAGQYTTNIPGGTCFDQVRYYFSVGIGGQCPGTVLSPTGGAGAANVAQTYSSITTYYSDDLSTDRGWVVTPGSPAATTGIWNRMAPVAIGSAQPGGDHTPGAGGQCWVTDGNSGTLGSNDVDGGQTILTSNAINLAGVPAAATMSYWRWFSNDQGGNPATQTFLVDVSVNNGTTWTRAETVGPTTQSSGGWIQANWTFASLGLTPSSQVKLRFTAQDNIGAVVEAAIDDILVYQYVCTPPSGCDSADFDCDGDVGTDADIQAFFACVAGNCPAPPCTNSSDFNHDGDLGTDADIEAFFRVLGGGPC
jgi:hypothetical protein